MNITNYRTQIPGKLTNSEFNFPIVFRPDQAYWTLSVSLETEDHKKAIIYDKYFDGHTEIPEGIYAVIKTIVPTSNGFADYTPTIVSNGKNRGKKNQTNAFTQALRDALSSYTKHKDRYEVSHTMIKPMLAKQSKFDGKSNSTKINLKTIDYTNAYIQRKYDGCRALVTSTHGIKSMYSRNRKTFHNCEHILNLIDIPDGIHIDGEMYLHGYPTGKIAGILNRSKGHDPDVLLEYRVYDMYNPSNPDEIYSDRYAQLVRMITSSKYVSVADLTKVNSYEHAESLTNDYIDDNYEGSMIRLDTKYVLSERQARSSGLIKWKFSTDSEFKIVDYTCGANGCHKDSLMYVCRTDTGRDFKLSIGEGYTVDEKIAAYYSMSECDSHKVTFFDREIQGKYITAKFAGLNHLGVPVHAEALSLYPREDLEL